MKHLKNFNDSPVKKTIMNIFICEYNSPHWEESISIFNSLNLPTSVPKSKGSHRGLSYQILLDVHIETAKELSNDILGKFPQEPLIVISEVNVQMKNEPIGWWQDNDLVKPGRYFDKLVSEGKRGIFIS